MTEFVLTPPPAVEEIQDARALQQRLYREIGLSAVAAALNVSLEPEIRPTLRHRAAQPSVAPAPARPARVAA